MKLFALIISTCLAATTALAEAPLPDGLGLGASPPRGPTTLNGVQPAEAPAPPVAPSTEGASPGEAAAPATQEVASGAATPSAAASPEQRTPITGTESIRKLISEQPDPSLVLEPPAEGVKEALKEAAPPPPPTPRPLAGAAPNPFAANGGVSQDKAKLRIGRIPGEIPIVPEVSIILTDKNFYPARIRLKEGVQARLFFTTTNEKPAAIIVEQMQIQRWVAKEKDKNQSALEAEKEKIRFEATREVTSNKVTEVLLEPRKGSYSFVDVISGAKGQLIVE